MSLSVEEFHQEDEREALRKANSDLQRRLKQAKAKSADLVEAVHQGAKEAALIQGPAPAVPRPRADRRVKRAEVALLALGDFHVGKRTATFNSDVARERVELLAEKVAHMTEIERADHPVRDCHVVMSGDFTDGVMIFPGQSYEVDSTLFAQMFTAAGILENLLRSLAATFQTVTVWGQTGNHGRLGRKGEMPRGDNADRLLYRIVHDRFSGAEWRARMRWHEPQSWYSIVEVGNYRALLVHGDQIKSFGGTPTFAILKKCNSWSSGVLPPFRDVYMGHWHNPLVLPLANGRGRVFVSPSIESDSAYAAEVVAAASMPAQRLNFVDPEKARVSSERILWLADG